MEQHFRMADTKNESCNYFVELDYSQMVERLQIDCYEFYNLSKNVDRIIQVSKFM